MLARTNSIKQSSFSKRSGLSLLISSMLSGLLIASCGPNPPRDLPVVNGAFPQTITDSTGTTIPIGGHDLSSVQPQDWTAIQGTYGGTLYHYSQAQDYTLTVSERVQNGQRFAYVEFRSNGALGAIGFSAYMLSLPMASYAGTTIVHLASGQIPAEILQNWIGEPALLRLELAVTLHYDGSRIFDPTRSSISIADCAVSVGVNSCSNQYPYEIAGFLNNFGKR